uniref:Retrotransposon gag domain-containing protein n=1 Tax=Phytophthora ramorum TaxID=164328 RepID=H3H8I3_PHYRM
MAKEAKSAVPATPARSSGTRTEGSGRSGSSFATPSTLASINERSDSFDEPMDYSDAKEDDEEDDLEEKAAMPELSEAAAVSAGRSGGVSRLRETSPKELNGSGCSRTHPTVTTKMSPTIPRSSAMAEDANFSAEWRPASSNGDTPAANRVLGRYLELMKVKSNWMRSFAPEVVRQAIWMELGGELTVPVESWNTRQVAEDTVQLLRAMGCEPQVFPSEADLRAWASEDAATALRKWKQKLRDPWETPTEAGIFSAQGATSTYFQDSHMVTPRSVSRTERLAREAEGYRTAPTAGRSASRTPSRRYDLRDDSSDEDSFDVGDTGGDLTGEWARQIRESSAVENDSTTPRLEIATHLPLGNTKPYLGLRDKSEKSMQWLRAFIYEMKGTHTPPNEWCMAFELSLQDGALHWYRQLPRKTRRTWKLLSDAFIKYYLTALNAGRSADARGGYPEAYNDGYDDTEEYGPESHSGDDDRYSEGYSDDGYASTEDRGHVAAANDSERRNAAEGTFARADNRRPRVHDAGKCEAFQELTNLLRAKVEKKDLSPELQELVYGSHLN